MTMKNKFLLLAAIPLLLFAGCARHKVARELKEFQASEIVVPSGLQQVHARCISEYSGDGKTALLVNYYDSTDCSSCRNAHLVDLLDLYELGDRHPEFQVLTIFSPADDRYDEVMAELMRNDFHYPVYVDYEGLFRKANPQIPSDERFHSFLLDKNMSPVFVGNPVAGQELWRLFMTVLDNMLSNGGEYRE